MSQSSEMGQTPPPPPPGKELQPGRKRWLTAGLFLTTLSTLLLELLDARLLSVLTWYHLSFLAISLAMLGAAAGAVLVFLAGDRLVDAAARGALWRCSCLFALSIPITHLFLMNLRIPALEAFALAELLPLVAATLAVALPFLFSGFVVTIALTRVGGAIGRLYAWDLVGAAGGCILLVPLLRSLDMASALLVAAAVAGAGAFAFGVFAAQRSARYTGFGTASLLAVAALGHIALGGPIDVQYTRGHWNVLGQDDHTAWNAHSYVRVNQPSVRVAPFFWGPGNAPDDLRVDFARMTIDGDAATAVTRWDGDPASLSWVQYDITTLPYHLRSGDVGIIGVGGGRDILSAIWSGAASITAVELNDIFIEILTDSHRDFAQIAERPELSLVHDEARSYLTRTERRFDVLQMSLIDTWAATGAGAFTLSENALYTVEAWRVFLGRLKPRGVLSTSRWFAPDDVSETSRLLSLCVTTLLDAGVADPARHLALLTSGSVATLLVSPSPLSTTDLARLRTVVQRYGFRPLVFPGTVTAHPRLRAVAQSRSQEELERAIQHPDYDYSAPTDARPYFFNMLKTWRVHRIGELLEEWRRRGSLGISWGNLRATATLMTLLGIASGLVVAIILLPLLLRGLPRMSPGVFALALSYFAGIGYGFMSLQIAFLQRFSVYLGHPVYVYSVILFTMILCAGIGSAISGRLELRRRRWHWCMPLAIVCAVAALGLVLAPTLEATIHGSLPARCAVVIALTAPVSTLLGFCFPFGLRLVREHAPDAAPWMWGVNGACAVLASILAVILSISFGIQANLWLAAVAYGCVAGSARALGRGALA